MWENAGARPSVTASLIAGGDTVTAAPWAGVEDESRACAEAESA
jgi:hypothetical protein